MSLSGSQRYNFEELRELIDKALLNDQMPDKLYKSVDGFSRIIYTILRTKGDNWAAQVLDENGKPLLTPGEQTKFTDIFKPYIESIINFFNSSTNNDDEMVGGNPLAPVTGTLGAQGTPVTGAQGTPVTGAPGTPLTGIQVVPGAATAGESVGAAAGAVISGMGNMYSKIMERINKIDTRVNEYASNYGILKLEKDYDAESNIGLPSFIATNPVLLVLSKIKIPFRTIVTTVYLILDITRLAIGSSGSNTGRKVLSILVALLELLRGDWKKAILTGIGFFGMRPMLAGQLVKVFLTVIRTLSPDIQISDVSNPLNIVKSFIVGLLLSIFQVTTPAFIREHLITGLNKIAERKAEINGTLAEVGLPKRPDYLSPSWSDLNNLQAVMSDKVYVCSCEFRDLVNAVNKSTVIKIVLELLRIPVSEEMIQETCGTNQCEKFATLMVKEGKERVTSKGIPVAQAIPSMGPQVPVAIPTMGPQVPVAIPTMGPQVPIAQAIPSMGPQVPVAIPSMGPQVPVAIPVEQPPKNRFQKGFNQVNKRTVRKGGFKATS
jgi:hypothetical protein